MSFRLVVGHGLKLTCIGPGAAFGLTRLMGRLLFGLSASDPLTFGAVAVVLLGVARPASRIDPTVALRLE
jgi:putative ABC transport system permease protein